MELLQRHGDAPEDIAAITVAVHEQAWELNGADPATTLAAKFSVPHAAAATAVLGHGGAEAFDAATLDDPRIAALRQKVEMVPFEPALPPPHDRPARVSWTLVDGTRREAECLSARGGPDRPFAAEEILAKIEAICDPVYPALGPAARRAIALDPAFLAEPWDRAVARITELGL